MSRLALTLVSLISGAALSFAAMHYFQPSTHKGNMAAQPSMETALDHAQKHTDPLYVCPMHPQISKGEEGSCPICGMTLVEKQQAVQSTEPEILYYRHPHKPTLTSPTPKKDEMGMDYIAIYGDKGASDKDISISPRIEQNMGVRYAQVERSKLWKRIEAPLRVMRDENRIAHIHVRAAGWVEVLKVHYVGETINKGQLLFKLYSPDLVNAQEEYLQALKHKNKTLIDASHQRLELLGVSSRQIRSVKKTRKSSRQVAYYAPRSGVITELNIRHGMYAPINKVSIEISDLSKLWLIADVFPAQASWLKTGQIAELEFASLAGQSFDRKIEYIYPELSLPQRTQKVRMSIDNKDGKLKPDDWGHATIYGGAQANILIVPRETIIDTGLQQRVVTKNDSGKFIVKTVVTGMRSGDWIEVKTGLDEGETVVTSGQFLLDSEASIQEAINRLQSDNNDMPAEAKAITGMGTITAVKAGEDWLKMKHEAISDLGWPSMNMGFDVSPDVDLSKFTQDDRVHFELEEGPDGYMIKAMKKVQP